MIIPVKYDNKILIFLLRLGEYNLSNFLVLDNRNNLNSRIYEIPISIGYTIVYHF